MRKFTLLQTEMMDNEVLSPAFQSGAEMCVYVCARVQGHRKNMDMYRENEKAQFLAQPARLCSRPGEVHPLHPFTGQEVP